MSTAPVNSPAIPDPAYASIAPPQFDPTTLPQQPAGTTSFQSPQPTPTQTSPTINSTSLQQNSSVQVPPPPTGASATGAVTSGNTMIASNTAATQPTSTTTSTTTDAQANFQKMIDSIGAPPSSSDLYNTDYANSGIDAAQSAYNTSKQKFDSINAQIAGLNAQNQGMNLQQEGRVGLQSQISGQEAENNRQTAIKAIPLQVAALAAQAEMTGNQNILQQAQQHLDTLFQIHQQDATNQYNYKKDLITSVYNFADKQEQAKLDQMKTQQAQDFTSQQNALNNAQDLAKTAITNGQSGLASQILALDPKSATYSKDVASIAGSIRPASVANGGTDTTPSNTSQSYALQAGDDPYNIAQNAGTDMAGLQKLNPNVKDWHNLPVGYKLNLPLPQGQLSTNPTVDGWAQSILNGSVTGVQSVPKQYQAAVNAALNTPGQNGYAPLAVSRFTRGANAIVNNYIALPQYQLTANGLPYLQRINSAMQNPGSVSDQDLLDSITKLNTAGNAISDAQVKVITDGKSLSDWANVVKNKVANGGILSPSQRTQIQTLANQTYSQYKAGYQPVYDQAVSQLKASGIPEAFWTIPDLNKLNTQTAGGGGSSSNSSGGFIVTAPDNRQIQIID